MHLDPVINSLRAAINANVAISDDPDLELAADRLAAIRGAAASRRGSLDLFSCREGLVEAGEHAQRKNALPGD